MKAGEDRGPVQIDMSGMQLLCWGLLLLNGLSSSDGISTDCNYTNVTTAVPPTVNCTSLDVKLQHVTPLNDGVLYLGSTATVRVSINLPVGFISELWITLMEYGEYVDFNLKECNHEGNINYIHDPNIWNRYSQTSFQRIHRVRYLFYNITTSYCNSTDGTENRLFGEFYVYLHNTNGLKDGQNISIYALASYQWNETNMTHCPLHQFDFTTRSQLVEMNKTASFAMVTPKTSELPSEINLLTKVLFKAWIPDYNPSIKVILQRYTDSLWIAYLRVASIGSSFRTEYGNIELLKVSSCTAKDSLMLEFPLHWVNRGYYESSNTTDFDVIEFEAGIVRTESAGLDSEQILGISIIFNDNEVWNSTVSFTWNSTDANVFSPVKMSIVDDLDNGPIVPSTNIPLKLVIETPPNMAETLDIRLWMGNLSGAREPAAIVKNVFFLSADSSILCYDLNTLYNNTQNSSVQHVALIYLSYVNSATKNIASITLTFEVNIVLERINFTDSYVVLVAAGNVTSEFKIRMNLPEIFNDRQDTLLGQFYKLLDGDNNTCIDLPRKEKFPPLFWARVHTAWLKINAMSFNMTMVGRDIPCQRNGHKISQVSFPTSTSKNGFHGDLKFCDLTYNDDKNRNISNCVYNCQCKNDVECSEVILFMANHENASVWNLCEISAVNV